MTLFEIQCDNFHDTQKSIFTKLDVCHEDSQNPLMVRHNFDTGVSHCRQMSVIVRTHMWVMVQ